MPPLLIVDDDKVLLEALPEVLKAHLPQIQVETCSSGNEALARVEARRYSTIVTDLRMPGVDGLTVLAEAGRARPETPVILITGQGGEAIMRAALEAGAYAYLPKPIERNSFVSTVKGALGTHYFLRHIALHERIHQLLREELNLLENVFSLQLPDNLNALLQLTEAPVLRKVTRAMERSVTLCERLAKLAKAQKSLSSRVLQWNLKRLELLGERSDHEHAHKLPERNNVKLEQMSDLRRRIGDVNARSERAFDAQKGRAVD